MPRAVELCREAESAGFTDAWSAEVGGTDGLIPLGAVATQTRSMRLGTAIIPVFTRPPALVAMSAATLQNLSGGRFVLGLGTSSSIIVEAWMGAAYDKPLIRLREYVRVVRDLLAGEKVTYEGETVSLNGFRLQTDPTRPVPIYLAALGRRACRLAGEVADGVVFFLKTPGGVAQAMEWVTEGARHAGRDVDDLDRVMRIPVALGEDEGAFRALAQRLITGYAIVDVYNRSLADQGFAAEVQAIASAFWSGDRVGAAKRVTEEMIEGLMIAGEPESARDSLDRFREAGITTPVIQTITAEVAPEAKEKKAFETVQAFGSSGGQAEPT
jgi:probable F420-dependent oxidoreductase